MKTGAAACLGAPAGSPPMALAPPPRSFPAPLTPRPLAERRVIQRYRKRDVRKIPPDLI